MKMLLISAAAVAAVAAIGPASAQDNASAPPAHAPMQMQPMTRDQVVQMVQKRFATIDANKDGFVTKDEMQAARTSHADERESAMFDKMDTNKDGSISRAEFDAAHAAMGAHHAEGGHMAAREGHAMRGAMAARMFATADADKDGRVSLKEATDAALAHFDSVDTNHDGTVTPDEMSAAHKGMHGSPSAG